MFNANESVTVSSWLCARLADWTHLPPLCGTRVATHQDGWRLIGTNSRGTQASVKCAAVWRSIHTGLNSTRPAGRPGTILNTYHFTDEPQIIFARAPTKGDTLIFSVEVTEVQRKLVGKTRHAPTHESGNRITDRQQDVEMLFVMKSYLYREDTVILASTITYLLLTADSSPDGGALISPRCRISGKKSLYLCKYLRLRTQISGIVYWMYNLWFMYSQ
jgi:hypothetical protein